MKKKTTRLRKPDRRRQSTRHAIKSSHASRSPYAKALLEVTAELAEAHRVIADDRARRAIVLTPSRLELKIKNVELAKTNQTLLATALDLAQAIHLARPWSLRRLRAVMREADERLGGVLSAGGIVSANARDGVDQ